MNAKHRRTLRAIFSHPTSANINWKDMEALFKALGADVEEREGSRVAVVFPNQPPSIFHRPHPEPTTDKGAVASIRNWLKGMGIAP